MSSGCSQFHPKDLSKLRRVAGSFISLFTEIYFYVLMPRFSQSRVQSTSLAILITQQQTTDSRWFHSTPRGKTTYSSVVDNAVDHDDDADDDA